MIMIRIYKVNTFAKLRIERFEGTLFFLEPLISLQVVGSRRKLSAQIAQ